MSVDFAFLDSGTGGIPYLIHLLEVFPKADCVYIGDTANFPYGEKTHEQIVQGVLTCVEKIIKRFNPQIIVLACNTMSVNALDVLRSVYHDRQFVGTVPAIKLAASVSKKRAIGLLATRSTVEHPYNVDLKNHFAADCRMELRGDPELISFIEHESFTATEEERMKACEPAVEYFREKGCDAIILGCTHFLNVKKEMQKVCGQDIQVVDSVDGVVRRAMSLYGALRGNKLVCYPAEGVAENTAVEQSETAGVAARGRPATDGVTKELVTTAVVSPPKLFITGFSDKKDEKEYDVICTRYNLDFGGLL
ncbi:MAG: glutamate racemase [Treponema sp.]|nr:glutamate racemase [Treponema sp.]